MDYKMSAFELFTHYAKLRGHKNPEISASEIIELMSLQKCQDTPVGNNLKRGVSGGEKKRVSIGIELISNPNLLFLDEPTTGLDSTTAYDIIENL